MILLRCMSPLLTTFRTSRDVRSMVAEDNCSQCVLLGLTPSAAKQVRYGAGRLRDLPRRNADTLAFDSEGRVIGNTLRI